MPDETTTNLGLTKTGTEFDFPDLFNDILNNWDILDAASSALNKRDATTDPGVGDDDEDGYSVTSIWANVYSHKIFICEVATTGAAVWRQLWPPLASDISGNIAADTLDGHHASYFASRVTPAADGNLAALVLATGDISDCGVALAALARRASSPTAGHVATLDADGDPTDSAKAAPTGAFVGTSDTQSLSAKTFSDAPKADAGVALKQVTGPSSPAAGYDLIFVGTDDKLYVKTSGGVETAVGVSDSKWTEETSFTGTPASTSTLTMTADRTGTIKVGMGLKYVISSVTYYGIVTAITSGLLTIAGAPLSSTVSELYWCDASRVIQADFFVPGAFADAANTGLLASDARTKFRWSLGQAYCVQILHTVRVDDSGANQPRVTISINGSVVGTDNSSAGQAVAETWTPTVVGINVSNYDINTGEAIEIVTDDYGSNNDATDLTVSALFVIP